MSTRIPVQIDTNHDGAYEVLDGLRSNVTYNGQPARRRVRPWDMLRYHPAGTEFHIVIRKDGGEYAYIEVPGGDR